MITYKTCKSRFTLWKLDLHGPVNFQHFQCLLSRCVYFIAKTWSCVVQCAQELLLYARTFLCPFNSSILTRSLHFPQVLPDIVVFNSEVKPIQTLHFKGQKCSGGKKSKERITVLVACNQDEAYTRFQSLQCFLVRTSLYTVFVVTKLTKGT